MDDNSRSKTLETWDSKCPRCGVRHFKEVCRICGYVIIEKTPPPTLEIKVGEDIKTDEKIGK